MEKLKDNFAFFFPLYKLIPNVVVFFFSLDADQKKKM